MKFINIACILLSVLIALPNAHQLALKTNKTAFEKLPIRLDDFLLYSLTILQHKLTSNTFTNEDMDKLGELMEFIFKRIEDLNERRQKEQTVYWLLRQGR